MIITRMRAHLMAITGLIGLLVARSSAPGPGITAMGGHMGSMGNTTDTDADLASTGMGDTIRSRATIVAAVDRVLLKAIVDSKEVDTVGARLAEAGSTAMSADIAKSDSHEC
jgi:hypothetical protein